MKLEKYAALAEIVTGIAVVLTLVILIFEVRTNTAAILAGNRQSIAQRGQELAMWHAGPDIAQVTHKLYGGGWKEEATSLEDQQASSIITANLRLAEEAYFQYRDGLLGDEYWEARSRLALIWLRNQEARDIYARQRDLGWYASPFADWLDRALEERYVE
jgi:hypothetical protein